MEAEERTRVATIERREPGLAVVRIAPGVTQTVNDALDTLEAANSDPAKPIAVLVDLRQAEPLPPEVRNCYSGARVSGRFSRIALLVQGSLYGRLIGGIYLRIARHGVPMRLFEGEAEAVTWLRAQP